jgi:multiple sugar transport system substrate-binding protein
MAMMARGGQKRRYHRDRLNTATLGERSSVLHRATRGRRGVTLAVAFVALAAAACSSSKSNASAPSSSAPAPTAATSSAAPAATSAAAPAASSAAAPAASSAAAPAASSAAPSITGAKITFSGWGQEEAATKADFTGFRTSFDSKTGADVSWEGWPYADAEQQLVLKAKANQAPDVAQVDINWVTTLAAQGSLVDLNTVYGAANLAAIYPANYLALGQRDGKQVALPWTLASIGLVANMSVLNKAGITTLPVTTADFTADLLKIKQKEPGVIPYGLETGTPSLVTPFLEAWLWTFGGGIVSNGKYDPNNPGTIAALTYLSGLIKQGLAPKSFEIGTARTLFAQGKVAFYDDAIIAKGLVAGTNPSLAGQVVPVLRPVVKAGDPPQSEQWGHALVMFNNSSRSPAQSAAAAQFMTYLENPAAVGQYFTSQGLLPATTAGLAAANSSADAYSTGWAKVTATSRLDETAPYVNGAQISTIVGTEAQAAYLGIETPAQAVQKMATQLAQVALQ